MAYEQRDNSGSIFKNDRKEQENHADLTGSCMVGGVEYWMKAWRKTPEGKKVFYSFSFERKDQQKGASTPETASEAPEPPLDDGIEF